jgi:hypothetical protein
MNKPKIMGMGRFACLDGWAGHLNSGPKEVTKISERNAYVPFKTRMMVMEAVRVAE